MNDSRRRRPLIQMRARRAMIHRIFKEFKKGKRRKKGEDVQMPSYNPYVRRARVYLKFSGFEEEFFTTSVIVNLPWDGATAKIREMEENGFWVMRPNEGEMRYFAPNQIRQVMMIGLENDDRL